MDKLAYLYILSYNYNMQTLIERSVYQKIIQHLNNFKCVALLGPRQTGKSTLSKIILKENPHSVYLDLEDPVDFAKLNDPSAFFAANKDKLICLDEIQRYPELFPVLRGHLDRGGRNGQILILGSASPLLIRQSSETLAGRISFIEITPFLANEINDIQKLWVQGGYPDSFLKDEEFSFEWRKNYIQTFLERDIPNLGINIPAITLRRLWLMLAHLNGQLLNKSKLGSALGVSGNTIQKYLDILEGTYIIRQLQPFYTNTKKRLIKSPKIYIRDTGLLHQLLGIESYNDLLGHPIIGESFESHVITSIVDNLPKYAPSFYRSSSGAEVDLVLERNQKKICIEIKASSTPKLTQGFYEALKVIRPTKSYVVANIKDSYPMKKDIYAMSLNQLLKELL